jgi:hypothetical protein
MMRTITVLALVLVTQLAEAQAPATFREGVLAFEKEEWSRAEKLMRETIAVNPNETEGTVSISGQWFETYVPHYFLARALAKQRKCGEALAAFAESERQGITPGIEDFARHLKSRDGCKRGREITIDVPLGGGTLPPKSKDTTTTIAPPPKSKDPGVVPPKVITPPKDIVVAPPKRPDPETRARLASAVAAYLDGRYEESLRLLEDRDFSDRAASAEAALFRAAAQHALYRIGGQKDASLRAAVTRELARYRSLRPNGRPDPRLFPPAFIALARK